MIIYFNFRRLIFEFQVYHLCFQKELRNDDVLNVIIAEYDSPRRITYKLTGRLFILVDFLKRNQRNFLNNFIFLNFKKISTYFRPWSIVFRGCCNRPWIGKNASSFSENNNKIVFPCEKCGKKYTVNSSLTIHKLSHLGMFFLNLILLIVLWHSLPYCISLSSTWKHMHKNVLLVCMYSTSSKIVLLEGEENQRPFKCDDCGKRFPKNSLLKMHVDYTHRGKSIQ